MRAIPLKTPMGTLRIAPTQRATGLGALGLDRPPSAQRYIHERRIGGQRVKTNFV